MQLNYYFNCTCISCIFILIAAEAQVIERTEKKELVYGLVALLSVAVLVFMSLLSCFVVGMVKRRREKNRYNDILVRNLQSQVSFTGSTGRRYSRGKSPSFSKDLARTRLSPTFVSQMSPTSPSQVSPGVFTADSLDFNQAFVFPQQVHSVHA